MTKINSKFVLWFSVYVRPLPHDGLRFDVMLTSLKTYSKIRFDRVYLNILLDDAYKHRKSEIEEHIKTYNCPVDYEEDRYTKRDQLIKRFDKIASNLEEDDFIFFSQNDDHPFIDANDEFLREGINHMSLDDHPYKSLYLSHWPEIIKLSLKEKTNIERGNYVRFKGIVCDSIQVFNVRYLGKILYDLIMEDTATVDYRIDRAIQLSEIFQGKRGVLAHIFVPLKEQCLHFDGYRHVKIPYSVYPKLKLPFEKNNFNFSREQLIKRMCVSCKGWTTCETGGKVRSISPRTKPPRKYIDTMLDLYGMNRAHASFWGRLFERFRYPTGS